MNVRHPNPAPAVLLLGGPTGVGKTEVALELAARLDGEIVSADARQVYRGLDIGTAKPTADQRRLVPHHLVDICDPKERYSAARFATDATRAIDEIHSRGRCALVVGGSGLYFRALSEGLFEAPETDEEVRSEVEHLLREEGPDGLRRYLAEHDPVSLSAIDTSNPARLQRAVEYHLQTGGSLALDRTQEGPSADRSPWRWYKVALVRPRAELAARLDERLRAMLASGWLQEVANLSSHYDFALPAFNAVGYRELYHVVRQHITFQEAQEAILVRTRQYAKRQGTWFRHQGAFEQIRVESGLTVKIASGFTRFAENKSA